MSQNTSIKNIFTYGAGQMVNLLAPFLVAPYVIAVCGIDKWGIIGFVTSVYVLIGLLVEFGANLIGVKELSAFRNNLTFVKNYIGLNYKFRLVSSLLLSLVLITVFVIFKVDKTFYWGLTWMVAWYYNPLWIYQAREQFRKINEIIILSKAVYVVAVYLLVKNATDYVYVVGILGMSNSIFYAWYYYQIPKNKVALRKVKVFVKQNKSIVISNFAITSYTQAPVFIIDAFLGNTVTGIYKVIDLFLTAFRSYLGVFFNATYPQFCYLMKENAKKARNYVLKMMWGNVALLVVSAIAIILILPYIIGYFDFSEEVRKGLTFSSYLLFLPVVIALNIPYYQVLLFERRNAVILKTSVIGVILTVALGIILTNTFDLIGICIMLYVVEVYITLNLWFKGNKLLIK
ncbi:MAG TPA: oligosaccharide flippase family protein [Flavobacterium sp.]|nr:oligosaccharide flippase family protein [Flavobacterium sp.]